MKKIENKEIKDDFSVLFDNNEGIDVQNYSYLIATKLDFEEKIKLLNTINETIIDTQSFPSIEELIKYDKEFSNFDSTGEYAIYMLWVIERHLINDKNIEAIKKTNKDLIKVIAYLASKLNNNETVDYDEGEKLKYLRPGIQ